MRYILIGLVSLGLAGTASANGPDPFDTEVREHQEALEIFLKGKLLHHSRNDDGRIETRIIHDGRYWVCEDSVSFMLLSMQLQCISLND